MAGNLFGKRSIDRIEVAAYINQGYDPLISITAYTTTIAHTAAMVRNITSMTAPKYSIITLIAQSTAEVAIFLVFFNLFFSL